MAVKLAVLRDELRATVGRVSDPQAKAMLEAEVLGAAAPAFVDSAGSRGAWRR